MSMILMVEAMNAKVGNPGRKLVLLKLADNANDSGVCWPSYQHVADQCEMGRSTVKAHIKALEEAGFLSVMERNGGKSSNKFQLHIGRGEGAKREAKTRSKSDPVENGPGQDLTPTRSGSAPGPGQDLTPEPITEPVIEPVTKHSCPVAKKTATTREAEDSFALAWQHYPKREGSNPKNHALSAWKARLTEGHTPEVMLTGLRRYLSYCQTKGNMGTGFVMQAKRFFGPSLEFLNDWEVSANQGGGSGMVDPDDTSWIHGDWGY